MTSPATISSGMTLSRAEFQAILKNDLMSLIERSFCEVNPGRSFVTSPHIELIAAKLDPCRRGDIKRLIINLPPRSLKSHCASVALPAWILGHNPATHIICVSYGQELADKFARDTRGVMKSDWYQRTFSTRLADRQAIHDFETTEHGTRLSTSVGGVLTGRGGDFIIIDGPLKPDEALSETRRQFVNDWYETTLLSRLNDKNTGCIIIVMQRLHQDDLVGFLLEREDWEVLSFSAIAEHDEAQTIDDPLGRRLFRRTAQDALHPDRESVELYQTIRRNIGEYNFQSQYQQNPAPPGGAMVKTEWLKYYVPGEQPTKFIRIVQSWDTANKSTELSDFSVCTTWGVRYQEYYLLDVNRQRLNYPDLRRTVIEQAKRYKPMNIVIEDKASGTQLIQDLKSAGLFGVTAYQPPTGSDKIMRLHAQTAMFENGIVRLPQHAPWLTDYVNELTSFPGTKYDDQVDSTTQALDYLRTDNALEVWARFGQLWGAFPRRW